MGETSATFNIDLEGNAGAVSTQTARVLEEMRQKIVASKEALRGYSETLSALKGKDQATIEARARLKAAMDREKAAISANALAIEKLGGHYGQLAAQARKATQDINSSGNALKLVGGPLASLRDKFDSISEAFAGADAATVALVGGIAVLAAAVAAGAAAAVAGAIAFSRWVLGAADAARSLELVREGAVNSTVYARALGAQIDALAKKVPTAKDQLNELGSELYRTFNNTSSNAKVGGQIIVDTMNLVAQATAGANAKVGRQLQELVERGKMTQRFQIGRQDLMGTGLHYEDVAGALSKNLKIGLEDAKKRLFEGRVSLADGAKALRVAVEERFGELNARKLLSGEAIFAKFHETLVGFAAGVNLEPLAQAGGRFMHAFDQSEVLGAALKGITETLGNKLVTALVALQPLAVETFYRLVNAALRVGIAVYEIKNSFEHVFGKGSALELAKEPFRELARLAELIASSFELASRAAKGLTTEIVGGKSAADIMKGAAQDTAKAFNPLVWAAKTGLGAAGFGPSIARSDGGQLTAPANDEGGMVARPAPGEYFASVAPGEQIVPRGGGSGAPATLQVSLQVNVQAGGQAERARQVASSPSFLSQATELLEHLFQAGGVAVQTVST